VLQYDIFLSPLHVPKSIITDKVKKGEVHPRIGCEDPEGK
jgi:hypothetical protein